MAYSTIIKKHCKHEGCKRYPNISLNGYCWEHAPEEIKQKLGTRKELYTKNKNKRLATVRKLRNIQDGDKWKLNLWYKARRYEMTGKCLECGAITTKGDDKYFKWCIAHIVAKSTVPSVSLHSQNFIELCWQHHTDYDSTFEKASTMKCFEEAKRKFQLFKDMIPAEEMRKVNQYLLCS